MTSDLRAMALAQPAFWRRLNPHLSIGKTTEPVRMARDASSGSPVRLLAGGTAVCDAALPPAIASPLALATRRICGAGLPGVFGMVYDEFWSLLAGAAEALAPVLGPSPRLLPDLWMGRIDPGDTGRPEMARPTAPLSAGRPAVVTVRIPLADASWRPGIHLAACLQRAEVEPSAPPCTAAPRAFEARLAIIGRAIVSRASAEDGERSPTLLAACRRWLGASPAQATGDDYPPVALTG